MAKARAAMFVPTPSMLFFPHGCSPQAVVELREAEMVFLSIKISQRENTDDRCVSSPPRFLNPRNIDSVVDLLLYLLSQLQHTHGQPRLQTSPLPFILQQAHIHRVFKKKLDSSLIWAVMSWEQGAGLGLVGLLYCLANLKVQLVKL